LSAERDGRILPVGADVDRDGAKAHVAGKLHGKMTKAAYSQDGDQVARARDRFPERVERCDSCALERSGIDRSKLVGNRNQRMLIGHHHLGVTAVDVKAGDPLVDAIDEVAPAAARADAAAAGRKPDPDALADRPVLDAGADRIDPADRFMPRHARVSQARKFAFDRHRVGMADAAGLHRHAHHARLGLFDHPFDKLELAAADCLKCPVMCACHDASLSPFRSCNRGLGRIARHPG
jgi:hypothetical protein